MPDDALRRDVANFHNRIDDVVTRLDQLGSRIDGIVASLDAGIFIRRLLLELQPYLTHPLPETPTNDESKTLEGRSPQAQYPEGCESPSNKQNNTHKARGCPHPRCSGKQKTFSKRFNLVRHYTGRTVPPSFKEKSVILTI